MMALVSDVRSIITVMSMLAFIGIVAWAYSAQRKTDFDEAANLPFADEENMHPIKQEPHHG